MTASLETLLQIREIVEESLADPNGHRPETTHELRMTHAEVTDKIDPLLGQKAFMLASDVVTAHNPWQTIKGASL